MSTKFLISSKDDNIFPWHDFIPQKLCLWLLILLFITSFYSTQKSDLVVYNSLEPQNPLIKIGGLSSSIW